MQSNLVRVALLVGLMGVAVALFVVLRDDGEDVTDRPAQSTVAQQDEMAPAEQAVEVIEMRHGAPVGGVKRLSYEKGDRVRIEVRLDEPQEDVHIHGYDIERPNPSRKTRFDFPAKIEGVFELEAHGPDGDVVLAELAVSPS
jgi:hypothetical protein